ncbi:MAG TPA: hypothetical protein VEL31_27505 [Ktedonobacteraceae bacterium]|nr:hypothetical protein [Ktedonobacteraceae bacterium]
MPSFSTRMLAQINGGIYGIAGYYSNYSKTQHIIVANRQRQLFEIHWNKNNPHPSTPLGIGHYPSLICLSGLVSSNNGYQHIVYATSEGRINELTFTHQGHLQYHRTRLHALNVVGTRIGMAGFFSTNDNCCHSVVVDTSGRLNELVFRQQEQSIFNGFPAHWNNIASIAGFYASNDNTRHIVVALRDGRLFDVRYDNRQDHASVNFLIRCPSLPLVIAAFFTPDNNSRHVVVRTNNQRLIGYAYDNQRIINTIEYPRSSNFNRVVDIAAYYSTDDGRRHIIVAHPNGNLFEIAYSRQ